MRIAGFLLLMLLYGAVYSFPALTTAMATEFGTSRTTLQGAYALWGLAVAALAPLAGRSVDRQGLRLTLTIGVISLVAMLIGLGLAQAPWQIYAVLIGFGTPAQSLLQVATIVAASRTGAKQRGSALGLAGAGIGVGLTFLLPGTVWLSDILGWRTALLILGGLTAIIGMPAVMTVARGRVAVPSSDTGVSFGSVLKSRAFALLFIGGIMIGLVDEALYQHLVPHLTAIGLSAAYAGTILGCGSLGYMGGQVIGGSLSDRWGRLAIGVIAAVLAGVGLIVFGVATLGNIALLFTAFTTGVGIGATIAVRSAALADLFDGPSLGLVTGTYQWSYAIGAAIIGWAGSYVYEQLGSYMPVFAASGVAAAVWIVCLKGALSTPPEQRAVTAGAQVVGATSERG